MIKKAFEQNEVVDFLQGINGYACPINCFVPANVPTDFGRIIDQGIYLLYKETKDEAVRVKVKNAILELLEGTPIQV